MPIIIYNAHDNKNVGGIKMTEVNYDVAIIGAGPAGMTAAVMHHVQT